MHPTRPSLVVVLLVNQVGKISYIANNWPIPATQPGTTDGNGKFTDALCVTGPGLSPQPLVPQNPESSVAVDAFLQYWCGGASVQNFAPACVGVQVQTDTFTRYMDHARPESITSP